MNTHQNQPYLQNLSTQSVHMLSDTIIIGRHQDCNLVLKSERGASRKHARITVQNGNVVIMDLGSLNGTLVNGREISRAVQLADGDIVVFDEQEYRFTGSAADSQIGSDNVTVIANKDEIGRPDRIKPAIRLVETMPAPSSKEVNYQTNNDTNNDTNNEASEASLDETKAWDSMASNLEPSPGDSDKQDTGQRYVSVSPAQAENQKKQRQELTKKLKTHEPQSQDPQGQKPQTPYSTPYSTPESPSLPMQQSQEPAPRDSEQPAGQDREPHPGVSQGRGQQSQENWSNATAYQARDPDAFDWQPDEPRSVKLPVQQQPAYRHQSDQADQADPQNAYPSQSQPSAQSANFHDDQGHFPPVPTTSRPGGDARSRGNDRFMVDTSSTRPGLQKHSYKPVRKKNVNWTLWFIVVPVMTLIAVGAVYLAYNAGVSAGTGSSSGFS